MPDLKTGVPRIGLFVICLGLLTLCQRSHAHSESWYWGFGVGPCVSSYNYQSGSIKLQNTLQPGFGIDLAFSFPVSQDGKFTLGPYLGGGSSFADAFDQTNFGISFAQYFGEQVGVGNFIRGDVGFGVQGPSNVTNLPFGVALGFAAGHGWALSEETRFIVMARLQGIYATAAQSYLFSILAGPLF